MTRRRPAVDGDDERGWMTLWFLGLCVMLLFVGGLSLDLWHAFSERRSLAAAADAGARAGASMIDEQACRD
jgi:Flp pilus assembly protein TadG